MPQVTGRYSEPRTQASVGTTNASTALTGPSGTFSKSDVGRPVSGTGIPAGTTLAAVASSTAATLSTNATATGTITLTIGQQATNAGQSLADVNAVGFYGWSPLDATELDALKVVPTGTDPARITSPNTDRGALQRSR